MAFDTNDQAPDFLNAADLHNIGNKNSSLFSPTPEAPNKDWDTTESITKFIRASLRSGVNELYNTAQTVGSWMPGADDAVHRSTEDYLQRVDTELLDYYRDHQDVVDAVGFGLSSLAPGLGGIKVLNVGQKALVTARNSGKIGGTLGVATGLLSPSREKYLAKAITELTDSNAPFSYLRSNTLKALGAGYGQQVLEAAAFEVAVAATMYESPFFTHMDKTDMLWNGMIFAGLGGVIGGSIVGAQSIGAIKTGVRSFKKEVAPWEAIFEPAAHATPSEKLGLYILDRDRVPAIPAKNGDPTHDALVDRIASISAATSRTRETKMRAAAQEWAKGDDAVAAAIWNQVKKLDQEGALSLILQSTGISRLPGKLSSELEARKLGKIDPLKVTDEQLERIGELSTKYLKLTGEGMGTTADVAPMAPRLADTLKKGLKIEVVGGKVIAGERTKNFSLQKDWDIFAVDHYEAEMRRIWAKNSAPLTPGSTVKSTDLPLLEKAYWENTPQLKVAMEDGTTREFSTQAEFFNWLSYQKQEIAHRLVNLPERTAGMTADQVADQLKRDLLVDFSLVDDPTILAAYASDYKVMGQAGFDKQVVVSRTNILAEPYHRIIQALKHEQGHSFFQSLVDIAGIDIATINKLRPQMEKLSRKIRPGHWAEADKGDAKTAEYLINSNRSASDIASAHEMMADSFAFAAMHPAEVQRLAPDWWSMFGENIHPVPQSLLDDMIRRKVKLSQEEIAAITNIKSSTLSGTITDDPLDYFADRAAQEAYTKQLIASGNRLEAEGLVDITNIPSVVKIGYSRTAVKDSDGNVLQGAMILKQKQREYQDTVDRVVANFLPKDVSSRLYPIQDKDIYQADIFAPGRGAVTSSNSGYNSLGNQVEQIGIQANKAKLIAEQAFKDEHNPAMVGLYGNREAAIEWSVLNQRLRNIPEEYIVKPDGSQTLVLRAQVEYDKKIAEAAKAGNDISKIKPPTLTEGAPIEIPVVNVEAWNILTKHISAESRRLNAHTSLKAVQGITESRKSGVFYPMAPDPRDYKHFAFVVDRSITGFQRSRMVYAEDARALDIIISDIQKQKPEHWDILTKRDAEDWYKSIGQFEYEKSLHDIGFDQELKRLGVSSPVIVPTDPGKIVNDYLKWHVTKEQNLITELISAKYQPQIDTLLTLGRKYTNLETSQKGNLSLMKYVETTRDNPYNDYVKTLLGIPKTQEYGNWLNPQKMLDHTISRMYDAATEMFTKTKSVKELEEVNTLLQKYGYQGVNYTASIEKWANHTAPKGVLTSFARKANAILATLTLRLDHLQAATNVISNNILYNTELKSIIREVEKGDAGAFAGMKVTVPGTTDQVFSVNKIHGQAIKNYFAALKALKNPVNVQQPALTSLNQAIPENTIQMFRDYGYLTSISDQFRFVIDELSLTGSETIEGMMKAESRMEKLRRSLVAAADKGEKWTGNRFAEEYNRFIAADSARQIMQVAVDKGIITEGQMWANIGTFVRRVNGTYEAFLRPAAFQGPVGQFIGLFQTYQFNLMQQLFRHVAEGDMKDAMLMMGLQGGIFGLQGMPAFNAINNHVIGTMTGNPEHKDIYSTVYSAGNMVGDWLMYGAASNMLGIIDRDLRTNLYTRGDINPRQLTVLPTDLEQVPVVGAAVKVYSGMKAATQNMANGGAVWQSLLQGIEHSSVNRPLAGLAVLAQSLDSEKSTVFTTTSKGNIAYQNDLLSLSNFSRLLGGRPFDEAIMRDLHFRTGVYNADFKEKRENLGRAIKTTLLGGNIPSQEQIEQFAINYTAIGGGQEDFNKFWMRQITASTKDQYDRMTDVLKSPTLQRLQKQMGGEDHYVSEPEPEDINQGEQQ